MPQTTFSVAVTGDDGFVSKQGTEAEWPPTGTPFTADTTNTVIQMRKVRHQTFAFTEIIVGLIRFDTSSIPSNQTVSAATLRVQCVDTVLNTRNLVIGYFANSDWPIDTADWSGADNPGSDAGTFPLSVFAAGTEEDLALTNLQNINLGGYTGLRLAIDGGQPVASGDPDHNLRVASWDHATLTEPQLIVTHDLPTYAFRTMAQAY